MNVAQRVYLDAFLAPFANAVFGFEPGAVESGLDGDGVLEVSADESMRADAALTRT